ncbi:hypothetical protein [uncultured Agrobacterium sp.]|uniref:hypothetical protein n=1 Tax=uncultured Agrobacterium sp. TaxID=157277 RepID=UPI0025FF52E0|nr:hypothetical protein [uncultured Agrobacterium sp.]
MTDLRETESGQRRGNAQDFSVSINPLMLNMHELDKHNHRVKIIFIAEVKRGFSD